MDDHRWWWWWWWKMATEASVAGRTDNSRPYFGKQVPQSPRLNMSSDRRVIWHSKQRFWYNLCDVNNVQTTIPLFRGSIPVCTMRLCYYVQPGGLLKSGLPTSPGLVSLTLQSKNGNTRSIVFGQSLTMRWYSNSVWRANFLAFKHSWREAKHQWRVSIPQGKPLYM